MVTRQQAPGCLDQRVLDPSQPVPPLREHVVGESLRDAVLGDGGVELVGAEPTILRKIRRVERLQ
jgi:hypothetical protein